MAFEPGYEPNFIDIMTASTDADARAKAQIMAQKLRQDQVFGQMGLLGGPRTAAIGQEISKGADTAEKGMLSAGVNRLHYGQQAQEAKERHDLLRQQMAADHDLNAMRIAELRRLGMAQGTEIKNAKDEAAANEKIRMALDPNGPRAGNYGQYAKRAAVLGDVERLLKQFPNPTQQQWYEIARAFDSAISMGGATVSGTSHLVPHTLAGDAAGMGNYMFNQARGMGAGAYHKLMTEAAANQRAYWEDLTHKELESRIPAFASSFRRFPDSTAMTLEGRGIDPSRVKGHPRYNPSAAAPAREVDPGAIEARVKQLVAMGKDDGEIKIILKSEGMIP